ncbi:flavin-binding monooxygenase [Aspergillus floccosus]
MNNHPADGVYDVIIIGAGISGINAAYHIQRKLPHLTYCILEGRETIGDTWDLFRYPGIRSDTDLHTFGFSWNPWNENRAIADGSTIASYLHTSAKKEGIDEDILFQHRVDSVNCSTALRRWELNVDANGGYHVPLQARFLVLGTGYYDYKEGLEPDIPGLSSNFTGTIAHPQFWPEDLDYADKRVVIIGSGATAIELLPNIAKKAAHVTMLQRSPTYIMSMNNETGGSWRHKLLPRSWSFQIDRWIFMWAIILYNFCRLFPERPRKSLQGAVAKQLPKHTPPWDQRVRFAPNGDFASLGEGKAHVETGRIKVVTADWVILESGKQLHADIVIPATGLKLAFGGRTNISVDEKPVNLADRYAWNTALLQDIPNLAFMMGYTNASWTLGAETTAHLLCRVLQHMQRNGYDTVIPRKAARNMPLCGDIGPWRGRVNYFVDLWRAKHGNITRDLEFHAVSKAQ